MIGYLSLGTILDLAFAFWDTTKGRDDSSDEFVISVGEML